MKDTIYLVITRHKVDRMTKSLPKLYSGEFPVKLEVEVAGSAFREPLITRKVEINDWREGVDLADVEFKESFITPEEAEVIKKRRLEKMKEILEDNGYAVAAPNQLIGPEDDDDEK